MLMKGSGYLVIVCPYCGGYQAIRVGQRSRVCPYCGKRFETIHARVVARAKDANEASFLVRYYKAKKAGLAEKLYGGDEGTRA